MQMLLLFLSFAKSTVSSFSAKLREKRCLAADIVEYKFRDCLLDFSLLRYYRVGDCYNEILSFLRSPKNDV